jgi:hypothetical protein
MNHDNKKIPQKKSDFLKDYDNERLFSVFEEK